MTVRLRRRRRVCAECGQTGRQLQIHDRRVKRWRHLDLGVQPLLDRVRAAPAALPRPAGCGSSPSRGRGRARRTRATSRTWWRGWRSRWRSRRSPGCCRVGWHTIGPIVARVVADHLDERRLEGLVCDRRRRDQLPPPSPLPDHRRRPRHGRDRVVRAGPQQRHLAGASSTSSATPSASIRAVSIDMSGEYQRAIRAAVPDAEICFDPFHVVRLGRARDRPGPPRRMERPRALAHPARGAGSRAPAGRCSRRPSTRPSASSPRSHEVSQATGASTAPSCCARNSGCSTTCPTPRSRPRTSTPGWPGPPAPACGRSSGSRAPCAATATASSPPSASASPTAASKASTARSA